ncbi:S-layer family protein [Microcoleus sp. FACHB-831]|uniref:two-partner secretion domain-containing protein n=1 Tax=Microcoleus sp. FACHB-831 TaxID=2692827 RepID=UPI001683CA5C|nr:S-layer family protein [Microcoleus sp. FACHB-831]MBD1919847.1 S-layer family protein [Microcoleus sp. FACHB-831]
MKKQKHSHDLSGNEGKKKIFTSFFSLFTFYFLPHSGCAFAQSITLDGTLGTARPLTGPIYEILESDGKTVGTNLFHSFGKFNLDIGERVNFDSAPDITNILTRVTGGTPSFINGKIYTNSGNVNLFLVNPSGIQFGANASLDVGFTGGKGSFVATTLDALVWPDGGKFSATNPGDGNSLLTLVGDPSGFISTLSSPKPIVTSNSNLQLYEGLNLLLVGGDVNVNGGKLDALSGRIELGGLASPGAIALKVDGDNLSLSFPAGVQRSNVSITNGAIVDATTNNGGSITINAANLNILGGSKLTAGILPGGGDIGSKGGDITLNATGAIAIQNSSIENAVGKNAIGDSGQINIQAQSVSLSEGAFFDASTSGQGDAGTVIINASDSVSIAGKNTAIFSNVELGATGKGGDIYITTETLSLTDGALLTASTAGKGDTGFVIIDAGDRVSISGNSTSISSIVYPGATGSGGYIGITTGTLSLIDGAQLDTSTFGEGDAGYVNIIAGDRVSISGNGASISSIVYPGATGSGGYIGITTGTLSLTDGALLDTSTFGKGNAGFVDITAGDRVSVAGEGTSIYSNVELGATGSGGYIGITTGTLSLTDGAQVNARTYGQGDAGYVSIDAGDRVSISGNSTSIFSNVESEATGNGGAITITAGTLSLTDGAQLNARTYGQGDAGAIFIDTRDRVSVAGEGTSIFSNVESGATGSGGIITIDTRNLTIGDRAGIAVDSKGTGNAGNLLINASESIKLDNQGFLRAGTTTGEGGNMILDADKFVLLRNNSSISATSGKTGNGGNIIIDSPFVVAVPKENSDIFANAVGGNGGYINLTTDGVYGLKFRDRLTPSSDITARSEFGVNGIVEIFTLGVDPSQDLSTLEATPVDVEGLVGQGCQASSDRPESKFVVTGKGGLPANPNEPLGDEGVLVDLGTPRNQGNRGTGEQGRTYLAPSIQNAKSQMPNRIVEAQGWVVNEKGEVTLTAAAPAVTPHQSWQKPAKCNT